MLKNYINFCKQNLKTIIPYITKDPEYTNEIKKAIKQKLIIKENIKTNYIIEYHLSALIGVLNHWIKTKDIKEEEFLKLIIEIAKNGSLTLITNQLNQKNIIY